MNLTAIKIIITGLTKTLIMIGHLQKPEWGIGDGKREMMGMQGIMVGM